MTAVQGMGYQFQNTLIYASRSLKVLGILSVTGQSYKIPLMYNLALLNKDTW